MSSKDNTQQDPQSTSLQTQDETHTDVNPNSLTPGDDSQAVPAEQAPSIQSSGKQDSVSSSVALIKRAEAEAAKAKAAFAQKEFELQRLRAQLNEQEMITAAHSTRQKQELDADLELLKVQKEAAMAQAEANALETFPVERESFPRPQIPVPLENSAERTERYVRQHTHSSAPSHITPAIHTSHNKISPGKPLDLSISRISPESVQREFHKINSELNSEYIPMYNPSPTPRYNPNATVFTPMTQPGFQRLPIDNGQASEFTRFLLKKELMLSRLTNFTDKPEAYGQWKNCFLEIMNDLRVTPQEEMDLLIKWLGPESSKQAISLRASNVNDPIRGLQRIWDRLNEKYGSPEMVEAALKAKLDNFPKLGNRDHKKLYELSDILMEIESVKEDQAYKSLLAYFDSSSGVIPIVRKLPYSLQEKWTSKAADFKKRSQVSFPPFWFFAQFIREMSKIKNDPSFNHEPLGEVNRQKQFSNTRSTISAKKTDIAQQPGAESESQIQPEEKCPLHKSSHHLNDCKGFRSKPLTDRKELLKQWGMCYRCCASTDHLARACKAIVKCAECGNSKHPSALHTTEVQARSTSYGGERDKDDKPSPLNSKCTQICGDGFKGKSCAKTVLVKVYPQGHREKAIVAYAILDDQSNASLAKSDLFNRLGIQGEDFPYSLSSCSGTVNSSGRRTSTCVIESLDRQSAFEIPSLIECNDIPNIRDEIPTPQVAQAYPHLRDIAKHIQPLNENADILLLIGRNLPEAHHISDQRTGSRRTPFAQKLALGWVIIGESCLGRVHRPNTISVKKTHLLQDGRTSIFESCPNRLDVKDNPRDANSLGATVFRRRPDDNEPGLSVEDRQFLAIMDKDMFKNPQGNWVAPLPFRSPRERLPNNRAEAVKRAMSLDRSLRKSPEKREHFIKFMKDIFDNGQAEPAPDLQDDEECWYLPLFGVYHPQKPNQIRGVFDSSSQFNGLSLNNVLLSGPDMTNNLLGILLRFRKEAVAVTADIQQMFHCFAVREDHRNFLRFFWYSDNDPGKKLVEYRMTVHVFGNTSSPAVATYGLRRTAQEAEATFGTDMQQFVSRDFYVDDGVTSLPTRTQAIDLMQRTQKALKTEGNLRLHKIASNDPDVMQKFPSEDLAKDLKDLNLGSDTLPAQRSLGLVWDLGQDQFTFQVSSQEKPFTRRGVLSTVNSLYDPLGFVSPVVIQGKLLLRDLIPESRDWDEPLPAKRQAEWERWRDSLQELEHLHIRRTYVDTSLTDAVTKEVHVYSDASEQAIAAVSYLKTTDPRGSKDVGFIMGKSKVAPTHGHTVPRLELCAAVLAVEVAKTVSDQLDIHPSTFQFHTDSRVVLGYIHNTTRRFYKYVGNRVEQITRFSSPKQWTYVSTESNPADQATRATPVVQMEGSMWLTGPPNLHKDQTDTDVSFPLQHPTCDKEIRPIQTLKTTTTNQLGSQRFERFSVWRHLVQGIANLKHISRSYSENYTCEGWHIGPGSRTVDLYTEAENHIIREVQREIFGEEVDHLQHGKPLKKDSVLLTLDPILDKNGMLRVGGRLNKGEFSSETKNPLIVPGSHHIALLLVRHHHDKVKHQGRHLTEGAVRAAGLWITGCKRLISSVIHKCIKCRKLRGKVEHQKMSDLPPDRLKPGPAFSYVGVDVFGHWSVVTRKTRGGQANSKRWAVLFTCLTTRAVHVEVIEEMSSSSFINALRRFIAIRGNVTEFRSDRGSNFVGSIKDLKIDAINVEDAPLKEFLYKSGVVWIFNPPHSSHMGGVWERMIGVARRILDSLLTELPSKNFTHEVLTTLMAEVCAIMNARPIVPVSSDPECPEILSPSSLLTQKTDHTTEPMGTWNIQDLYKEQWKCVQALSDKFWNRWRNEYIHTLQSRRKWCENRPDVQQGDVILLKDKDVHRNDWPVGVIVNAIPGSDGKVRKAEVRVPRNGKCAVYTRPITEMVVLLSDEHCD